MDDCGYYSTRSGKTTSRIPAPICRLYRRKGFPHTPGTPQKRPDNRKILSSHFPTIWGENPPKDVFPWLGASPDECAASIGAWKGTYRPKEKPRENLKDFPRRRSPNSNGRFFPWLGASPDECAASIGAWKGTRRQKENPRNRFGSKGFLGAVSQIRTGDLILTKDALCLLSYNSIGDPDGARTHDL